MYVNLINQPEEIGYDLKKIISMLKKAYGKNLVETNITITFTATFIIIKVNNIEYNFYHSYILETDDEDDNICIQANMPLGILLGYNISNHQKIIFNINEDETLNSFTLINKDKESVLPLDGEVRLYDKTTTVSSSLNDNIINDVITMKTSKNKGVLHINNTLKVSEDKSVLFNINEKKVFRNKLKYKYLETNFVFDENIKYIKSIIDNMNGFKMYICKNNKEQKYLNIFSNLLEINIYEQPIDNYYQKILKTI